MHLSLLLFSSLINANSYGIALDKQSIILIQEAYNFQYKYGREVWSIWEKEKYPLLFKTAKYDYLIHHPNPALDFTQKYFDNNLQDTVWFRENKDTLEYQAAYPINGIWTIVISEPTNGYDEGLWILKFAHECFHLFQADMREDRVINPFTDEYADYNELNFPFEYDNKVIKAAMRLEAEVIFNSIKTDSLNTVPISISKKLFNQSQIVLQSVNQDKEKYMYKQWMEWNEGIARYTERELAFLVKDSTATAISDDFKRTFPEVDFNKIWENNYKNSLNPIRFIGEGVRGRVMFYYSGMGKAYYLDRASSNWKEDYFNKNLDQLILN